MDNEDQINQQPSAQMDDGDQHMDMNGGQMD